MMSDMSGSRTPSQPLEITWLGHACFRIAWNSFSVVLDPYDPRPGLPPLQTQAHKVLTSHAHSDHNFVQAVEMLPTMGECPFTFAAFPSYHDKEQGAQRGPNTIHRIEAGGLAVLHLGDLGHPLAPELREQWGIIDALMVPVGGYYTIDASEAKEVCDLLRPRVVIPMHFRIAPDQPIGPLEDFLDVMQEYEIQYYDGRTIQLTSDTASHVAVLSQTFA